MPNKNLEITFEDDACRWIKHFFFYCTCHSRVPALFGAVEMLFACFGPGHPPSAPSLEFRAVRAYGARCKNKNISQG